MAKIHKVTTNRAPAAIGPYSQAIRAGGFVFVSGQIPLTPKGEAVGSDISTQAKQALENLRAVLRAAGSDLPAVVKVNVYLKDLDDFQAFNEVYQTYLNEPFPARAAVEVARLPKDMLVEIECIAIGGSE